MNAIYPNEVSDLWILINENILRMKWMTSEWKYIKNEVNDWRIKIHSQWG